MPITFDNPFKKPDTYADLLWQLLYLDSVSSDGALLKPDPAHSQPDTTQNPKFGTNPSGPPQPTALTDPPPRVFALVIGINKYKSSKVCSLHGAVSDANAMESYLKVHLKVPGAQIRSLRDEEATRSAVIKSFNDFQDDTRIRTGDAIVIFYAGHGGEAEAPPGWESEYNKTQYLLPHDFETKDQDGQDVYGIPDRTLASILNRLARAKGDNILVIFDCCHSGSGTRTEEPLARVSRLDDKLKVPSDLDRRIWRDEVPRGASVSTGFAQTGLLSHVLLTACGAREQSLEDKTGGRFTNALLTTLRTVDADKVTYRDLLNRMPAILSQNPHCEGVNQNRILFNARAPSPGRVFYKVSIVNGKYLMEAGAAHGITDGAEFTIYEKQESPTTASVLGVLTAHDVKAFNTTLAPLPEPNTITSFANHAYAVQTKAGEKEDLRLHVALNEDLIPVFSALAQHMQRPGTDDRRIQLVELDKNPHLHVDIEEGRVVFENLDPLVTKYGLTRMPYTTKNNVDDIYPVIRAAAHFRWHVELTNPNHTLQNKVELHVYELREKEDEYDDDFLPIYEVIEKNLNVVGEVFLSEDPSKTYGFKVVNNSPLKLYPSLFYFDNSSFEIQSFYQPPFPGRFKPDAPLQPFSSVTIGYGAGGYSQRSFSLAAGQNVDVGFLKLFLTTRYVDYSNIPQPSPFDKGRGAREVPPKTMQTWDTIKVAVVQKKDYTN
ncbi:caspase domain-containing protein [Flammula alnicola]|nr:caspase domain-containing protein [Flammula alnicola]